MAIEADRQYGTEVWRCDYRASAPPMKMSMTCPSEGNYVVQSLTDKGLPVRESSARVLAGGTRLPSDPCGAVWSMLTSFPHLETHDRAFQSMMYTYKSRDSPSQKCADEPVYAS